MNTQWIVAKEFEQRMSEMERELDNIDVQHPRAGQALQDQIENIRDGMGRLRLRLGDLRRIPSTAWEDTKAGAEIAWEDLREGLGSLRKRLTQFWV